jgi:hypothetical protein
MKSAPQEDTTLQLLRVCLEAAIESSQRCTHNARAEFVSNLDESGASESEDRVEAESVNLISLVSLFCQLLTPDCAHSKQKYPMKAIHS